MAMVTEIVNKLGNAFSGCLRIFVLVSMMTFCFGVKAEGNLALDRLATQVEMFPQEKIHVVTDRDMYCAGDTVWLRTFVVDAISLQNAGLSKYAYIELRNPFKEVVNRIKLIDRDGVFSGYIPLAEDMPEGDYTLVAYTAFSENQGKDYFFRKPLRIEAPYSSKYKIDTEFTNAGEGEVKGHFSLKSLRGDKMHYTSMSWTMPDGSTLEFADSPRGFSRKFKRDKGEDVVLVKFGDYAKYVPIYYPVGSTEMQFYPEGGWLIAGVPCEVAFKATDEDGRGVAVSSKVLDKDGTEVASFSSSHKGMGKVSFVPEKDMTYKAEYIGPEGVVRYAEIGTPKPGMASLRYVSSRKRSVFSVAGGEGMDLELILACRGKGIIATPISFEKPISINKEDLPTGLYQALLVSPNDSMVVSERLFFIGADRPMPEMSSISTDSMAIKIQLPIEGNGDCSVRVLNYYNGNKDQALDARTQLLLQSELRGRIEDPGYYFSEENRDADRNLDLLMMVNGWSRYNLPDVIMGKYTEPSIPLEIGQEISGKVRSRWRNKPLEGVAVYAIAPKKNFGTVAESDANGEFHLDGFDFPEGTAFIFRAMNEKGGNEGNYDVTDMEYPVSDILLNNGAHALTENEISDFFKGSPWIMLDEINVQAFANKEVDVYELLASHSKTTEDFDKKGITTLEEAVRGIAGMSVKNDGLYWRNYPVTFFIDGVRFNNATNEQRSFKVNRVSEKPQAFWNGAGEIPRDPDVPESSGSITSVGTPLSEVYRVIPFDAIARIDFLRSGEALILGNELPGGALMITTKDGGSQGIKKQFELKDYIPLGYQRYKQYASPLLSSSADAYDLQGASTLLWLPSVIFDEKGKEIELKLPIQPDYKVIIEGTSDMGPIYESH